MCWKRRSEALPGGERVACVRAAAYVRHTRGATAASPQAAWRHAAHTRLSTAIAGLRRRRQHPSGLDGATHHRIVGFLRSSSGRVAAMPMRRGQGSTEESVEVRGRYVIAVDDGNAYLPAGLAGMGVLWLARYMAAPHAARAELIPLFDSWRPDPMPMYPAYPPTRHVSAKLRVFMEWIDELMATHAPMESATSP